MIFNTPECGQSAVNRSNIDEFQLWVLTPLGSHFGGVLGAQMEAIAFKKPLKKNIKKNMPTMSPKWSQRGSQNGAKIIKNEVLEAPCFKGGSQEASRAPPGSILERFWDHFGTIFVSFSDICLVFFACILQQYVTNRNVQFYQESSKEYSRELPRKSFSPRAILH